MREALLRFALFAIAVLAFAGRAHAHDVPPSRVLLDVGRAHVEARLELPLVELWSALGMGQESNTQAVAARLSSVEEYVLQHVRIVSPNGRAYSAELRDTQFFSTNNLNWTGNDWLRLTLRFTPPRGVDTSRLELDYDAVIDRVLTHKAIVAVRTDLRTAHAATEEPLVLGVLGFGATMLRMDGSQGSWARGFVRMLQMGFDHIRHGADHLMFLVTLLAAAPLLASRRGAWDNVRAPRAAWWQAAKVVSGFTLGHSLTLLLASSGIVDVPSAPIEILVALTILVSALHVWRPLVTGGEMLLAAAFGLVHGLAFAEALSGFRFDAWTYAVSLVGFNVGAELAQLVAIAAILPLMVIASRFAAYRMVRGVVALIAGGCATAWALERAFGVGNPLDPLLARIAANALPLLATCFVVSAAAAVAMLSGRSDELVPAMPLTRRIRASVESGDAPSSVM